MSFRIIIYLGVNITTIIYEMQKKMGVFLKLTQYHMIL